MKPSRLVANQQRKWNRATGPTLLTHWSLGDVIVIFNNLCSPRVKATGHH